jgi:polyketide cyclase/dehydrase/lipid transport protein
MKRLELTRDLPVGAGEGFDYITNVDNWPEYWPRFVEAHGTRWREPGDQVSVVVAARRRPTQLNMTLEEFIPKQRVTYRSTQEGLPDFQHERLFADSDGRLRYTLAVAYEPRGLFDRVVLPRYVRRSLAETMDNLERIFAQS